jgi:hypothetical protein
VVCGIIRRLPECRWTAVKITQYGHGVCSHEGEPCECADPRHPVAISEERGADPSTDSGRFLAAGAARAFWLRTPADGLGEAMPRLRRIVEAGGNVIVESNSVLRFLKPDLCLIVMDGAVADFKPTSRRFLDRAHALVVTSGAPLSWEGLPAPLFESKPHFRAFPPGYENDDLIALILARSASRSRSGQARAPAPR